VRTPQWLWLSHFLVLLTHLTIETATSELADKFSYYWYPSADDLLIISPSFEWIIGVRHDGALFFYIDTEVINE
jgi:hypothetical protein